MKTIPHIGKSNIPILGLGTWQLFGNECVETICRAVEIGYRHIDTASMYENQKDIGRAIRALHIERESLFITSKVWVSDLGSAATRKSIEATLRELKMDYLDLYLIHWPGHDQYKRLKSYEIMVEEQENGRIKYLGVSNFTIPHLVEIEKLFGVPPVVNQIFMTPVDYDQYVVNYCKENDITITAYSPLGKGRILDHPKLVSLTAKYNKKTAQIALRWFVDNAIVVIPKSSKPEHLQVNFDIFGFELDGEDLAL